jgi:hypothetical protein
MESLRSKGSWNGFARRSTAWLYGLVCLTMLLLSCSPASALPAFARKYGLPCSSCHEGWPKLSYFGQQFKDNGYQLGNDRDAPIFQQAAYWPVTFRITPYWSRQSTSAVQVDGSNGFGGNTAKVTTDGFNLSGLDFHTGGTLAKNVSFYVLPSSDEFASFHFESVWARIDNVANSPWLNFKLGKFELDNLLSEKRILTLTSVGGQYWNYHFQPFSSPGIPENYTFGIGDNQLGFEWMGHSADDRWRASASVLTASDGTPDVPYASAYDMYFAASRAFQLGSLGVQRIGGFAYIGQAPTYYQYNVTSTTQTGDTINGVPATVTLNSTSGIPGTGAGNKWFEREGVIGMFYARKYNLTAIYFHGHDSAWLGTDTAAVPGAVLPVGAHAPSWNGALFESNYDWGPRLVLINRYELVRMSQQAFSSNPSNLSNLNTLTFGARYYPFINSRAGFAYHGEYAIIWQNGAAPVTNGNLTTSQLLFGFDFDF